MNTKVEIKKIELNLNKATEFNQYKNKPSNAIISPIIIIH